MHKFGVCLALRSSKIKGANPEFSIVAHEGKNTTGLVARSEILILLSRIFEAQLLSAQLTGATLIRAHLNGADLSQAQATGANLFEAEFIGANLTEADLRGADLNRATLVKTNLEGADLTACSVYGISAWNVKLEGAIQSNLVITPKDESPIRVDNLEVAQFIYLLLSRQKLRDVIATIGEKAVLILGRFTGAQRVARSNG